MRVNAGVADPSAMPIEAPIVSRPRRKTSRLMDDAGGRARRQARAARASAATIADLCAGWQASQDEKTEEFLGRGADEQAEQVDTAKAAQEDEAEQDHRAIGPEAGEGLSPCGRKEIIEHLFAIQGGDGKEIEEQQDQVEEDELGEKPGEGWKGPGNRERTCKQSSPKGYCNQDRQQQIGQGSGSCHQHHPRRRPSLKRVGIHRNRLRPTEAKKEENETP